MALSPKTQPAHAVDAKDGGVWPAIRRNPAAMVLLGLYGMVCVMFNVQNIVGAGMAAEFWGDSMTTIHSSFQAVTLAMGVVFAGAYGRFGDRHGNRLACAILMLLSTLPYAAYLVFGLTELGLWAASGLGLLQGFTGLSMSGAPCMFALLHELVLPEDFAIFMAILVIAISSVSISGTFVAHAIQSRGGEGAVVWFGCAIGVFTMGGLALLPRRKLETAQSAEVTPGGLGHDDRLEEGGAAEAQGGSHAVGDDTSCALISSVYFAMSHPLLLRLCVVTLLLSASEGIAIGVMSQFVLDCLGWLGAAVDVQTRTSLLFNMNIAFLATLAVACLFLSMVSAHVSAYSVLIWTSLIAVVVQVWPPVMLWMPHVWYAFVVVVCVALSMCVGPATSALVPLVSPPGRVGEAMGAMGSFKCLSFLVGNVICISVVPLLHRTNIAKPLWLFFPWCSFCALCAVPLAIGLRRRADGRGQAGEQQVSAAQ